MKFPRQSMPLVLLLSWLAIDVVSLVILFNVELQLDFIAAMFLSVLLCIALLGQAAALSGWLVLGTSYRLVHWCLFVVFLWIFLLGLTSAMSFEGALFLMVGGFVWNLPVVLLRLFGWSIQFEEHPRSSESGRFQIRLWELVALTTVVAIVLGVWQGLSAWESAADHRTAFLGLVYVVAYLLPTCLWMLAFWARPTHTLVVTVAISAVLARVICLGTVPGEALVVFTALLLAIGSFVIHAFGLRWAGYRLERGYLAAS